MTGKFVSLSLSVLKFVFLGDGGASFSRRRFSGQDSLSGGGGVHEDGGGALPGGGYLSGEDGRGGRGGAADRDGGGVLIGGDDVVLGDGWSDNEKSFLAYKEE